MLLEYALEVLARADLVRDLIVVVPAGWEEHVRERARAGAAAAKLRAVVAGGATRQESVWCGLQAVGERTHVLIHDAARPFITDNCIERVARAAARTGAASVATPVSDTLMRAKVAAPTAPAEPHVANEIVDREGLWALQTPQMFELALIRQAHKKAARDGLAATDDGTLILHLGKRLELVPGSWWNIKVTQDEDWQRARMLRRMLKSS